MVPELQRRVQIPALPLAGGEAPGKGAYEPESPRGCTPGLSLGQAALPEVVLGLGSEPLAATARLERAPKETQTLLLRNTTRRRKRGAAAGQVRGRLRARLAFGVGGSRGTAGPSCAPAAKSVFPGPFSTTEFLVQCRVQV